MTSNPSPDYVKRIAAVFDNSGHGMRGDLAATVEAILLDPEAREGDIASKSSPTGGHLREPVLYMTSMLRALGATIMASNALASPIGAMGQVLLFPPSVFNYYSPFYRIANGSLAGPEFQLLSPSTAVLRANVAYLLCAGAYSKDVTLDLSSFTKLANDPGALVDAIDLALTRGQMPANIRKEIIDAISITSDPGVRVRNALFLAASSNEYQVQR